MKKIIFLSCCMVFFSAGVCNADSDIEKLKGCWRSLGIDYEIGDNYYKKLSNNLEFELIFEKTDTHIVMRKRNPKLKGNDIIRYVNRKSITDDSFVDSKKKESSPDKGLKFTRIQCPK